LKKLFVHLKNMQATLALVTTFYVANAHRGEPRPIGGNPFGCPQGIAPEENSYCASPGLVCNYPSLGSSYSCGRDYTWLAKPPSPQSCFKDGFSYNDGFKFINSQGCTEWECKHGAIQYNNCPAPPHGCFKDGVTYPNHYQPSPDAAGCVEWQCENGKIRYNPCPAHQDGCWRNGFYYHDGFTKYTTDGRHCALWQCENGHIEFLGACPEKRECRYQGRQYPDGYTYYTNGCATWTCSDGHIAWLGGCPPVAAECEHNGHKVSVGTRVENYRGPHFNCANAECTKQSDGTAKFTCILG